MFVCVFVCVYVIRNKKKYWADLKKKIFPSKVWTAKVTLAILEVLRSRGRGTLLFFRFFRYLAIVGIVKVPYHKSRERVDGFQKFFLLYVGIRCTRVWFQCWCPGDPP